MRPIDKSNPVTTPVQIRFTDRQLNEMDSVAQEFGLSRSEVIRLSCSAGLVALKKLTPDGLKKAIARVLIEE